MTVRALLGLGSNLGDRVAHIHSAVALLGAHSEIEVIEVSSLYETEPVSMIASTHDEAPPLWFVNAALEVDTELSAFDLLVVCLAVEKQLGRDRSNGLPKAYGYRSRTLDIDVLFFDNQVIQENQLTVPHPRLHERAFVLAPLLELAPDWKHPITGKTIRELHQNLRQPEAVSILGTHAATN